MKNEVFYISNHGFGHLTRCLAQIDFILDNTNKNIYIACGKKQNDFARIYLSKYKNRVIYSDIETDVGFINKQNSLTVDKDKLQNKLYNFIENLDALVNKEIYKLNSLEFEEINVDISPLGVLVGERLNKKIIMTTNFTWYSQYRYLNIDNKILNFYKDIDSKVSYLRKYPLHFGLEHFTCDSENVEFISRKIDSNKVEKIKKKYGKSIIVTLGRSANISEIKLDNFHGTVFYTEGLNIRTKANLVKLPINILDTQNYIAASDLVISKAGWGTISECVVANTPMILIERPTALEDTLNIRQIINMKKGLSLSEKELKQIEVNVYEKRLKDLCSRS